LKRRRQINFESEEKLSQVSQSMAGKRWVLIRLGHSVADTVPRELCIVYLLVVYKNFQLLEFSQEVGWINGSKPLATFPSYMKHEFENPIQTLRELNGIRVSGKLE